jgi:hypothetical protein
MTYETLAHLEEDALACEAARDALKRIEAKKAVLADLREDILTAASIKSSLIKRAMDDLDDWDAQLSDLLGDIRGELSSMEEELEEPWA